MVKFAVEADNAESLRVKDTHEDAKKEQVAVLGLSFQRVLKRVCRSGSWDISECRASRLFYGWTLVDTQLGSTIEARDCC